MKQLTTIITSITLFLFSVTADAHDISKGTIILVGDTSLEDSSVETKSSVLNDKIDTTVFNFTGGYFFAQNTTVALLISNEDSKSSDGSNSSTNMIGPFIGYNISLNTNLSLMLAAGLFNISGDLDDGAGNSANFDGDGTLLMATLAFFINDNVAINFGLRKTDSEVDITDNMGSPSIAADFNETATNIGLSIFF